MSNVLRPRNLLLIAFLLWLSWELTREPFDFPTRWWQRIEAPPCDRPPPAAYDRT